MLVGFDYKCQNKMKYTLKTVFRGKTNAYTMYDVVEKLLLVS
jgi:hypothetical protein